MRRLGIAVIGAGRLGGLHAQKLATLPDVELVAVVDPIESRRHQVAAACRTQALADHRPLAGRTDAAVVATPTQSHYRIALELLKGGVHALVEKPLCATAAQADELVNAARQSGAILQVGHVERFNPAFEAACANASLPTTFAGMQHETTASAEAVTRRQATRPCAGSFGPKFIEAMRAGPFTFRSADVGVVLDLMIHDLDLVLAMAGPHARKVDAVGLSVLGGHEDVAHARLEFQGGCVAVLSASRVSHEAVRRMQIWSGHGLAGIDFAARKTTLLRPSQELLRRELDVTALAADEAHNKEQILQEHLRREEWQFDAVDALRLELEDFVDSIRRRRAPRVSGEDGRDAVALAERILQRIHAHRWADQAEGLAGPPVLLRPPVIPTPHFPLEPAQFPVPCREAG